MIIRGFEKGYAHKLRSQAMYEGDKGGVRQHEAYVVNLSTKEGGGRKY